MSADADRLSELLRRILEFRDARDWKQFHTPKDMAISLSLEAAELLEHVQWRSGEELDRYLAEHRKPVSGELADVLYWVLLMAHDLGIDISAAFEEKMRENEAKYPADKARGSKAKYR